MVKVVNELISSVTHENFSHSTKENWTFLRAFCVTGNSCSSCFIGKTIQFLPCIANFLLFLNIPFAWRCCQLAMPVNKPNAPLTMEWDAKLRVGDCAIVLVSAEDCAQLILSREDRVLVLLGIEQSVLFQVHEIHTFYKRNNFQAFILYIVFWVSGEYFCNH